ncbi:drug/metabolite transporter (DMT)-like permease [Runella defluvii]|uniref:Drug/metabolite transporter (DMT)-like permease n=1 Tax=Runella defluvii TaxID=370973 RepID=A0A7W6EQN9_9BACT|nr:DMT family transporter [Runella defluvii]MBB3838845.1 drug/metabolite transporter (DMT)-like permease [Runella defluvii]
MSWTILFACNFMWAFHFTSIKLTQDQVGPYFTVWAPMLLATILLGPFVVRDFKKGGKKLSDILIFVQLAALGAFPSQVLMTWGTQYSLASNAAILVLTLPVITAVFAFLILKERMNVARWVSFAIAIIGVALCSTDDIKRVDLSSKYALGNVLIFLAILGNAYYNVGCKKIAEKYTEIEMVFYTYLVMCILLTPLVLYYEPEMFGKIPEFTTNTWIGMISLTVFHNFLSMVLFFKALKHLDATQVALSNYLITFMGLPIAAFWLGEKLNSQAIIGGLLVLVSTLILSIVDSRVQQKKMINNNP